MLRGGRVGRDRRLRRWLVAQPQVHHMELAACGAKGAASAHSDGRAGRHGQAAEGPLGAAPEGPGHSRGGIGAQVPQQQLAGFWQRQEGAVATQRRDALLQLADLRAP